MMNFHYLLLYQNDQWVPKKKEFSKFQKKSKI